MLYKAFRFLVRSRKLELWGVIWKIVNKVERLVCLFVNISWVPWNPLTCGLGAIERFPQSSYIVLLCHSTLLISWVNSACGFVDIKAADREREREES